VGNSRAKGADCGLRVLASLRQIVVKLQGKPHIRSADAGLFQPQGQVGAYRCPAIQYAGQGCPRHTQSFSRFFYGQAQLCDNVLAQHLAWMSGVFRGHDEILSVVVLIID
jgi:hypothetical protein